MNQTTQLSSNFHVFKGTLDFRRLAPYRHFFFSRCQMLSQLEYKCLLGDEREGAPSAVNRKKLELRPPCTHGVRDV